MCVHVCVCVCMCCMGVAGCIGRSVNGIEPHQLIRLPRDAPLSSLYSQYISTSLQGINHTYFSASFLSFPLCFLLFFPPLPSHPLPFPFSLLFFLHSHLLPLHSPQEDSLKFATNAPADLPCPPLFPGEVVELQQHRVMCVDCFPEAAVGVLYLTNYRLIFIGNSISVRCVGMGVVVVVVLVFPPHGIHMVYLYGTFWCLLATYKLVCGIILVSWLRKTVLS